jgi:hypothetical protein
MLCEKAGERTFIKGKSKTSPQIEPSVFPIDATQLQAGVLSDDLESSQWKTVSSARSIRIHGEKQDAGAEVLKSAIQSYPHISGFKRHLKNLLEPIISQHLDNARLVPS